MASNVTTTTLLYFLRDRTTLLGDESRNPRELRILNSYNKQGLQGKTLLILYINQIFTFDYSAEQQFHCLLLEKIDVDRSLTVV